MNDLFIKSLRADWSQVPEDSYLQQVEAVRNMEELTFSGPVTFFAGENGRGKSTLLEAIAVNCGFSPEGGTWNYKFAKRMEETGLGIFSASCRKQGASS